MEALATKQDLGAAKRIGLSGHLHGATSLAADDSVLWPCVLWNDTRSAQQAAAMNSDPA